MKQKTFAVLLVVPFTVISLLIAEFALRLIIFGPLSNLPALRRAGLYSYHDSESDYWKLDKLFKSGQLQNLSCHPLLGWLKSEINPVSYVHSADKDIGSRTPVLLYGDSYAKCQVPSEECFEGILNADPAFHDRYLLINYGVAAYGLDQIYLLYKATIDRYESPIVIFGFLDYDIDRCLQTIRHSMKPYFIANEGSLVLRGVPVQCDFEKYLREHPLEITSYLWRLLILGVLPRHTVYGPLYESSNIERKKKICERILSDLVEDLRRRSLRHIFLVFQSADMVFEKPDWRIRFLRDFFAQRQADNLFTTDVIKDRVAQGGYEYQDYFVSKTDNHPNKLYNRLVSDRLRLWIKQ